MREIKFRAFDKLNTRIVNVESIDFIHNQLHFFNELFNGNPSFITDYELMQYTGLKDKNGVEVYEGDIVRLNNDDCKLAKVEFIEFCFKYHMLDYDLYNEFSSSNSEYIEVIGNIYEHSHFLDSK